MKKISTTYIKSKYDTFNCLFFSNRLPSSNKIKFISTSQGNVSAGYMMLNNNVISDKFKYMISFNKDLDFSDRDFNSVLCHEMIHIWQMERINKDRYTSSYEWQSSHDKVFVNKMSVINQLADENNIDMYVDVVSYM